MAVMQKHLNEVAARPSEVCEGVSPACEAVIRKMMSRRPENRYASAGELAGELAKVAGGGVPKVMAAFMAERRKAGRRRPAAGVTGTRGASTKSTRPIGTTGVTRPLSPADAADMAAPGTTADTAPLAGAGRRMPKALIAAAAALVALVITVVVVVVVKTGGGDEEVTPVEPVETGPTEAELRLARLEKEFERLTALEKESPDDFKPLVDGFSRLMIDGKGTSYALRAREALARVTDRQDKQQAEARIAQLKAQFAKARDFERANPEKYKEIVGNYERLAGAAIGTRYAAEARSAADATRARRKGKARQLLSSASLKVESAVAREDFKTALAELAAFPELYVPDVRGDLVKLEAGVRAAGRKKWEGILAAVRELTKGRQFAAARKRAAEGRTLGQPELEKDVAALLDGDNGEEKDVAAALDEISGAEKAWLAKVSAAFRAKYTRLRADFKTLATEGRFREILDRGKELRGKLGADLEVKLAVDMAVAQGAQDLVDGIRARLKKLKAGAFYTRLPLGDRRGRFMGYNSEIDSIDFRFAPGGTSMKVEEFHGELMVMLARRSAGGKLSPKESRLAACYLAARGATGGEIPDLLKKAAEGGVGVDDVKRFMKRGEAEP